MEYIKVNRVEARKAFDSGKIVFLSTQENPVIWKIVSKAYDLSWFKQLNNFRENFSGKIIYEIKGA